MVLRRRHLRPGETDHELVWLLVGLSAATLVWMSGPALAAVVPPCPLKAITGWPCVGCGATRALVELADGAVGRALWWNPLATVTMTGWALWGIYAAGALLFRARRWRLELDDRDLLRGRWVVAACVSATWLFLLMDGR